MSLTPTLVPLFCLPGLMEIRSVSVGVVAIKSVSTGLYLAMSKKGTLFGSVSIQPRNNVSGRVVNMGGGSRGANLIHIIETNWPRPPRDELALEKTWARKSRKGQRVVINQGWNTWATIPAAPVGLSNCQNRYQRRHQTSSDKEPSGPPFRSFCMPSVKKRLHTVGWLTFVQHIHMLRVEGHLVNGFMAQGGGQKSQRGLSQQRRSGRRPRSHNIPSSQQLKPDTCCYKRMMGESHKETR